MISLCLSFPIRSITKKLSEIFRNIKQSNFTEKPACPCFGTAPPPNISSNNQSPRTHCKNSWFGALKAFLGVPIMAQQVKDPTSSL